MGGGDLRRVEPGIAQDPVQPQLAPSRTTDDLRAELHDVFGGDAIDKHTIDLVGLGRAGRLGAPDDLQDAVHPDGRFRGKLIV